MAKVVAIRSLFIPGNVAFLTDRRQRNSDYFSGANHSVLFREKRWSASARGQNVTVFLRQSLHVSVPAELSRTPRG